MRVEVAFFFSRGGRVWKRTPGNSTLKFLSFRNVFRASWIVLDVSGIFYVIFNDAMLFSVGRENRITALKKGIDLQSLHADAIASLSSGGTA